MDKSTIEDRDGKVVLVTPVRSEETARRLRESIQDDIVRAEGDVGDKIKHYTDRTLKFASDFFEILDRSYLTLLSFAFGGVAAALAAKAWPAAIPIADMDWLMSLIGILMVVAISVAAHQIYKAAAVKNGAEFYGLLFGMLLGVVLNALASIALQSQIAVERQMGWEDVQREIQNLQADRSRQEIEMLSLMPDPAGLARIEAEIKAIRSQGAINREGVQLNRTVGELVGDCNTDDGVNFYEGTYCPDLSRREGDLKGLKDREAAYQGAQQRLAAIDGRLTELQSERPQASTHLSFLSLFTFVPSQIRDQLRNTPWLQNVILTLVMEALMVLFGILAGRRAYRTRHPKAVALPPPVAEGASA